MNNQYPPEPPGRGKPFPHNRKCSRCQCEFYVDAMNHNDYLCKDCKAKAEREKEQLELQKMRKIWEQRWRKICPPLYHETDETVLPQALLKNVLSWDGGAEGLWIHGPTGTAKSRTMYLLIKKLILEGQDVLCFRPTQFEETCVSKSMSGDGFEWCRRVKDAEIVFFDDFVKAKITQRVEEGLFNVIDYRWSHKLPILGTSNSHPIKLTNRFSEDHGEPLIRRLLESVEVISTPLQSDVQQN